MSCPYFYPVRAQGQGTGMLPLGDAWAGICQAEPGSLWQPDEFTMHRMCNLGYARGTCGRFPHCDGPDAVRFTIAADTGPSVRVAYVVERDHHPFAHGALEYSRADGRFATAPPTEAIAQQAGAYVASYLRRKSEDKRN